MVAGATTGSFLFINSSDSRVPKDGHVRLAIRQQAMSRAAAARIQRGNYGKANLRQNADASNEDKSYKASATVLSNASPESLESDLGLQDQVENDWVNTMREAKNGRLSEIPGQNDIAANLSSTGYEALRSRLNVDIQELSAVTTYHDSRVTFRHIQARSDFLVDVLRCRQWSFMYYVPSRWGRSPYLDAVIECVLSSATQRVFAPGQTHSSLRLYQRALATLQAALNDPNEVRKPEVLCATELLALHELVSRAPPESWEYHIAGSTALVRLRGPYAYSTPFEKALLLALAGPIYTASFQNGEPCFLEEPSWQAVLHSSILKTSILSDCSEIVVSLWITLSPFPRIAQGIYKLICQEGSLEDRPALTNGVLSVLRNLGAWKLRYDSLQLEHFAFMANGECDKRFETLGVYMTNTMVQNRFLLALNPSEGQIYEDIAQSMAHRILELGDVAAHLNARAGLFLQFKCALANVVLESKDEWQEAIMAAQGDPFDVKKPISRAIFARWYKPQCHS